MAFKMNGWSAFTKETPKKKFFERKFFKGNVIGDFLDKMVLGTKKYEHYKKTIPKNLKQGRKI